MNSESGHVVVSGATGLIGAALVKSLVHDGRRVIRLVRRPSEPHSTSIRDSLWDPAAGMIDASVVNGADAVVHLAGEPIAGRRWSTAHKRAILESRLSSTSLLTTTIVNAARAPRVFVSGSAVGFYGDRGDETLTESSAKGAGFLADVVAAWEGAAAGVSDAGVRVVLARSGVVLSTRGGALAPQLLPFKLGLGGRLGTGRQYLAWISLRDEVGALRFLLDSDVEGPVNLVAPEPVTNSQFTKALGAALHRPTVLPIPLAALRARFGSEMVSEMVLASQRVLPVALSDAGFVHHDVTLGPTLQALISGQR